MSLEISEKDFNTIMGPLGYPAIPLDVLEFDEITIKNIFIQQALDYYFSRFPIRNSESWRKTSNFEIPFPDENTFGVVDARVNRKAYGATTKTESVFQNALLYSTGTSKTNPAHLQPNSFRGLAPDEAAIKLNQRLNTASNIALRSTERIRVEIQDRKVSGYVNVDGELIITWAKTSNNFNDVPFKDREYVISLAQSIVLKRFAMIRDQANTGQGVDFNTQPLHNEAEKQEQKAIDKWAKRRAVVVIR